MFVKSEIWNVAHTDQGYAVLIKPIGSDAAVPIFVGQLEAQSILIGLGHISMPRPNTHDLLLSSLKKTGNTLEKVEITGLIDGVFYATIHISNINGDTELDSRPSDAIALAVRANCPLFISEEVIDETAVSLEFITEKTDTLNSEYDRKRLELEKELDTAIKLENYEEAAELRDKLKKLDEEFF